MIINLLRYGTMILISAAPRSIIGGGLSPHRHQSSRQNICENSVSSRQCWGEFNIGTNYYIDWPDTGVTREYWLSVRNETMAPDGYQRSVLTFNGTIPGPTIEANWGDRIIVHVSNDMQHNGTAVHWHGVRQLGSSEYDGVPGVTQCPIPPGTSMTYNFQATQYGTSWYHSHFSLQYADGLLGPLVINGPATADYDEDLGTVFLSDWSHIPSFTLWESTVETGAQPTLENGLINGMNVFDCSASTDSNCLGTGSRFELSFTPGKKYRIRLINTAVNGYIRFTLDNHIFQVIANDFVPIVPYTTNNILIAIGQRYDIVVEANAPVDNYWLRSRWQVPCARNLNAVNFLGIVRYEGASLTEDPASQGPTFTDSCADEPLENLVPYVEIKVGEAISEKVLEIEEITEPSGLEFWTINTTHLRIDWDSPTQLRILDGDSIFPTPYNIFSVTEINKWVYWVIQDVSLRGTTHPIHLHGHDFFTLAQGHGVFDPSTIALNKDNPPRRDVMSMPGGGYLVIAFYSDNPGSWLMHCHIAWHASAGFALQFVEREPEIASTILNPALVRDVCAAWNQSAVTYLQDDSGI